LRADQQLTSAVWLARPTACFADGAGRQLMTQLFDSGLELIDKGLLDSILFAGHVPAVIQQRQAQRELVFKGIQRYCCWASTAFLAFTAFTRVNPVKKG